MTMELPNPKELKALLKVCREFGVETFEANGVKLKLGEMPQQDKVISDQEGMAVAGPTEEELAFWSTQPDPLAARMAAEQ